MLSVLLNGLTISNALGPHGTVVQPIIFMPEPLLCLPFLPHKKSYRDNITLLLIF